MISPEVEIQFADDTMIITALSKKERQLTFTFKKRLTWKCHIYKPIQTGTTQRGRGVIVEYLNDKKVFTFISPETHLLTS